MYDFVQPPGWKIVCQLVNNGRWNHLSRREIMTGKVELVRSERQWTISGWFSRYKPSLGKDSTAKNLLRSLNDLCSHSYQYENVCVRRKMGIGNCKSCLKDIFWSAGQGIKAWSNSVIHGNRRNILESRIPRPVTSG
ncbi:hypothetical protein J6590_031902 [Homalodisca vitripennis]|nr:hypothetical protein J6590_031902 [Homalodisca vitripennis]